MRRCGGGGEGQEEEVVEEEVGEELPAGSCGCIRDRVCLSGVSPTIVLRFLKKPTAVMRVTQACVRA